MRRILLLFFLLISVCTSAQIVMPAKWSYRVEQKKEGEAVLIFNVKIDPEWHLYSQFTPDGGSLPTVFKFDENKCFTLIDKVTEPKPEEEFDSVFGVKVFYFKNGAEFRQKIKTNGSDCIIKGSIQFEVCKQSCVMGDTTFDFTMQKTEGKIPSKKTDSTLTGININPDTAEKEVAVVAALTRDTSSNTNGALENNCGAENGKPAEANKSFLGILIAGMLGGFLALLTPCVFPMIPMTVSFFTKRSGSRRKGISNAIFYALSIIVIYVVLGLIVTVSFGSDALNDLSSNAFFNLAFFIIFVIFAISFFGAFEITLPSWIINRADSASDRGGMIGIFFMAFTLSLVSFSCTGPIIGTLLVEAAQGQSYTGPLAGMFGFSLALAIPFALFSLFPGWLNSIPKSGSWLNTVKVCLGFLELALALKFLSNVDLAYHWGFLKRELFISLWIIIFLMMGFYLLGKLKLSHDNDIPFISTGRLMFSLLVFGFSIYLIPGVWGAPLRLISGFPPPEFYKEWKTGKESDCPHDLNCFHDYEEGMRYARAQHKPALIDFTGWACVNCRRMEDQVWSNPAVLKKLSEDYVLISLYVDDKTQLPQEMQVNSTYNGRLLKTTGNKWSDLQAGVYKTNTQPYYVLLDTKEKILAEPRGGMMSIKDYSGYLEEGLCRFRNRK